MRSDSIAILIPAAGFSRRMRGRDKLMEKINGEPLIARAARIASATGARVIVTLPPTPAGAARETALLGLDVETVIVPDAAEGMAASLRAGATLAGTAVALMILLPDLPDLEATDLSAMIAAFPNGRDAPVLRATAEDGTPGHPVILPARLIPALAQLGGDHGAHAIIADEPMRHFALPGTRATTDLDTPEAWETWRARQPG